MKGSKKIGGMLVEPGRDSSPVLNPAEEALDDIAIAVDPLGEVWVGRRAGPRRYDGLCAAIPQQGSELATVIALVAEKRLDASRPDNQSGRWLDIVDMTAGHEHAQGTTEAVDQGVDLCRASTARMTYGLVNSPLFAPAAAR